MARCPRCKYSGRPGFIKVRFGKPGQDSRTPYNEIEWETEPRYVECPVCLGLGTFDRNPAHQRPDIEEGSSAVHSLTITMEDAIELLPIVEEEPHE